MAAVQGARIAIYHRYPPAILCHGGKCRMPSTVQLEPYTDSFPDERI
jgi:hypothetical protein